MPLLHTLPRRRLFLVAVIAGMLTACAGGDYIHVSYQLPVQLETLESHDLFLQIVDRRTAATLFGEKAREKFSNFTGNFSLSLSRNLQSTSLLGAYDLKGLFQAALAARLEQLHIRVLTAPEPATPSLEIGLTEFKLDKIGHQWVVRMAYEAALMIDGSRLASQSVAGQGERFGLRGRREANRLVGEVFTDVINRLDLNAMLRQTDIGGQ